MASTLQVVLTAGLVVVAIVCVYSTLTCFIVSAKRCWKRFLQVWCCVDSEYTPASSVVPSKQPPAPPNLSKLDTARSQSTRGKITQSRNSANV